MRVERTRLGNIKVVMSEHEAMVLHSVTRLVGGDPEKTHRRVTEQIRAGLSDLCVNHLNPLLLPQVPLRPGQHTAPYTGGIFFKG